MTNLFLIVVNSNQLSKITNESPSETIIKITINGRARRILAWIPALNSSLDSSFERLDILGSPVLLANPVGEVESNALSDVEQENTQVPLTPILNAVFLSPTQCN
ncbi:uncharacterized protein LOC113497506 [Trichoplusia ni]|uniref:Uncharacterized protein LOC113497506 n=1 Tax=Trichoplusia ni TaxID=7111 RepID=A0A7E5VXN9_TRINI|nr:uncharacterized protein LOC113497506 [Trichoplusia ni]